MATKDGDKRSPSRTTTRSRDTDPKPPTGRGAAKQGTSRRAPHATREATPAEAPPTPPTRRRASKPARPAEAAATPAPIEATAEAELPVTQAEVTTEAEPGPDTLTSEESVARTALSEPAMRLPEALGDDLAEQREAPTSDDVDSSEAEMGTSGSGASESGETPSGSQPRWMRRERMPHGNALGMLIERQFSAPGSPCRSYSDLERRSGISREALSRYVTTRPDRRRSPTIDTLVAIADAMHLSLDATCRAAAATAKGTVLASPETQRERDEIVSALIGGLSDDQFSAVVELLRQMRPAGAV